MTTWKKEKDARLVYSTDPSLNKRCERCKELMAECSCAEEASVEGLKITAVLRYEKQGRNGKPVTVIDRLPKNEAWLKELSTALKKKCGAGGTYRNEGKDACIEIQGDKRDPIRAELAKRGIACKG
jgi:translation initiation factor 1